MNPDAAPGSLLDRCFQTFSLIFAIGEQDQQIPGLGPEAIGSFPLLMLFQNLQSTAQGNSDIGSVKDPPIGAQEIQVKKKVLGIGG